MLGTDNGGYFCGKKFDQFYKQHNIARQNKSSYTRQQNEVAERMNGTLMGNTISMLSDAGLS